ncbi:rhodanese-like domain-containing protein [Chloroflexota bacterium]
MHYFNKDVVIGISAFIAIMVLGFFTFQIDGNRNDPEINLAIDFAEIPRIDVREVKEKLDSGFNLVIVDTRSKAEYEQMHIAGAVSVPLAEIAEGYTWLKDYEEVIAYCT